MPPPLTCTCPFCSGGAFKGREERVSLLKSSDRSGPGYSDFGSKDFHKGWTLLVRGFSPVWGPEIEKDRTTEVWGFPAGRPRLMDSLVASSHQVVLVPSPASLRLMTGQYLSSSPGRFSRHNTPFCASSSLARSTLFALQPINFAIRGADAVL